MELPVYTQIYVHTTKDHPDAFPAEAVGTEVTVIDYLRPARIEEAVGMTTPFYIRVKHPLKWPLAVYDYKHEYTDIRGNHVVERYQQATIVAAPKMGLI